jgi:hypothetical protein
MSVSEAINAGANLRRMNGNSHHVANKSKKGASRRVNDARAEQQPVEDMLLQLREIIVGPYERLSEARFEEMLEIMSEQQDENENRFQTIETDVGEIKVASARMEKLFSTFDLRVDDLAIQVDEKTREVHEAYGKAIHELKGDFALKMEMIAGTLQQCLKDLELETRKELLELSSTLMAHVTDEDKRLLEERDNSSRILDQRIAQWRAEMEDDRREDMDNVASSLMEIGQRMLALRKTTPG